MRRPIVALLFVLPAAVLPSAGCSLLGLDRFEFPRCIEGRCAVLNARDRLDEATACELWQCDAEGEACVFGPRDSDHDTFVASFCTIDGVQGTDCNDDDASAGSMDPEVCNGVDDDCNGLIDEVGASAAAPIVVSGDALSRPDGEEPWLAYAHHDGDVSLVTGLDRGGLLGATFVGSDPLMDARALSMATSANLTSLNDAATAAGCARTVVVPLPTPRSCVTDADCTTPATRCVTVLPGTARICERPVLPRRPAPLAGDCTAHYECSDGLDCNGAETCEPDSPSSDGRGCRAAMTTACSGDERCSESRHACIGVESRPCGVSDLAFAPSGSEEWLTASVVSWGGCLDGVVMLGHHVLDDPGGQLVSRGPSIRSTSWTGLDTDGACTGLRRGSGPTVPQGAAGISIATLPPLPHPPGVLIPEGRRRPQGLVAFLAAPVCRGLGTCAPATPPVAGTVGPVDVEVVGVWLEETLVGSTPITYANATGDGHPTRLGVSTDADVRDVAVVALDSEEDAGYVVAYPVAGGIAAHFVPALGDPEPACHEARTTELECTVGEVPGPCATDEVCVTQLGSTLGGYCLPRPPCVSPEPPHPTLLTANAADPPRTTPDLIVPAATTLFAGASPTGSAAAAAFVPDGETTPRLVFAWPEATEVVVGTAELDPRTGAITGASVVARAPSAEARSLSVIHVTSGMTVAGATVGGTTVLPGRTGGIVVTWRDTTMTHALRISDHTGAVHGPALGATLGAAVSDPHAFAASDGRLGVVARDDADIVVIPAVCGP